MFPAGALRRRLRCVSIDIDTHAEHFRTRERGGENDPQFLPRETPLAFFLLPVVHRDFFIPVAGDAIRWCARDLTRQSPVTELPCTDVYHGIGMCSLVAPVPPHGPRITR